jgi:anti-sigma regulatory factor (Ser/Thr protein kinase)
LSTNAVRHGVPPGGLFLVQVDLDEEYLRIEVHDSGTKQPKLQSPGDDDDTGRGLHLVDVLTHDWGVLARSPSGKVVWVEFKVPAPSSATLTGGAPC